MSPQNKFSSAKQTLAILAHRPTSLHYM